MVFSLCLLLCLPLLSFLLLVLFIFLFVGLLHLGIILLFRLCPLRRYVSFRLGDWRQWPFGFLNDIGVDDALKLLNAAFHVLVDSKDSSQVLEISTIVRCTEDCDQFSLVEKLIPLLDHLMRTTNQVEIVLFQERIDHITTKVKTNPTVDILIPPIQHWRRIRP